MKIEKGRMKKVVDKGKGSKGAREQRELAVH